MLQRNSGNFTAFAILALNCVLFSNFLKSIIKNNVSFHIFKEADTFCRPTIADLKG